MKDDSLNLICFGFAVALILAAVVFTGSWLFLVLFIIFEFNLLKVIYDDKDAVYFYVVLEEANEYD